MENVRFIRRNGRIIPILRKYSDAKKTSKGDLAAVVTYVGAKHVKAPHVKPNFALSALSTGAAIASGVVGGVTLFRPGFKAFLGSVGSTLALDTVSTSANIASYAGKGKLKGRLKGAARAEARNTILGNAVFATALFAHGPSRTKIIQGATKLAKFIGRRAL